jgi:hypothetical protein
VKLLSLHTAYLAASLSILPLVLPRGAIKVLSKAAFLFLSRLPMQESIGKGLIPRVRKLVVAVRHCSDESVVPKEQDHYSSGLH